LEFYIAAVAVHSGFIHCLQRRWPHSGGLSAGEGATGANCQGAPGHDAGRWLRSTLERYVPRRRVAPQYWLEDTGHEGYLPEVLDYLLSTRCTPCEEEKAPCWRLISHILSHLLNSAHHPFVTSASFASSFGCSSTVHDELFLQAALCLYPACVCR
jgi:hypothetical protein